MRNPQKEKMKKQREQAMAENPGAASGRRLIFLLLIAVLSVRVLHLALELTGAAMGYLSFSALNVVTLLISVFLAWVLCSGIKFVAVLWLLGAGMMVLQTFQHSLYAVVFSAEYAPVMRLYAAVFILASYVQVIGMLILVLDKKANIYYKASYSARRRFMEEEMPKKL